MTTPGTYVVQPGDTLTRIAAKLGVDWHELAAWNGIPAPYVIHPGDVLRTIPPAPAPDPLAGIREALGALSQRQTDDEARLTALTARVAALESQQPSPAPTPAPQPTLFGANTSTAANFGAVAKLLAPAVWRYYLQPGEKPHMPTELPIPAGTPLIVSSKIKPQDVVTGKHDADLAALFRALSGGIFCPWHEPADDVEKGHFTVAQYRAAWDHIIPIARKTSVRLAPILMRATYAGQNGRKPADYLPDDYDFAGVDAYVAGSVGVGVDQIGTLLDPVRAASDRPIIVGETGIGRKVTGQARADTLTKLAAYLRDAGDVQAVCYFLGNNPDTIQWSLSAAEAAAWKAGQSG